MTKWNGLARNKKPRATRPKTAKRNHNWKMICLERAKFLIEKYGYIVCEYSGERIECLATVPNSLNDGWGHHIDSNRNNCTFENCYIVKYKYHHIIEINNLKVKQEGFEGKK
jgi:hypothetical protein